MTRFPPAVKPGQEIALRVSTIELAAKDLTAAQRKWVLRGLHENHYQVVGLITNYDFSAFGKSNFERMMAKLTAKGLVGSYHFAPWYRLTDHGINVAKHLKGRSS